MGHSFQNIHFPLPCNNFQHFGKALEIGGHSEDTKTGFNSVLTGENQIDGYLVGHSHKNTIFIKTSYTVLSSAVDNTI